MKDTTANISQITLLKQKLHSARAALEEMNEDHNQKLASLLQFIGHLSLACKGQNLELDNKLAKLRHKLGGFDRVEEALPELVEVEQILKQQYNHVMVQLEDGRTSLSKVIRQLQRVDSAPAQLKKRSATLNKSWPNLSIPFGTIFLKSNAWLAFTTRFYKSN